MGIRRGCIEVEVCAKLPHKRQLPCFLWCWFQLLCPCNALSCCQFSAKIAGDIEVSKSFCKKRQLCKRVIVKKAANSGYINEHSHCSRELIISLYSVPLDGIWNTASSFGLPHTRQTFSAFSRGYWGGVGSSTWPVRRHRGNWACSAWSRDVFGETYRLWGSLPVPIRLSRRQNHALRSGVLQEDERQQAESREVHTGYKNNFIYVRTVSQWHRLPCLKGCAVFILGGFQALTGSSLE